MLPACTTWPLSITATVSPRRLAKLMFCSTSRMVTPLALSSAKASIMLLMMAGARPLLGSSTISSSRGSTSVMEQHQCEQPCDFGVIDRGRQLPGDPQLLGAHVDDGLVEAAPRARGRIGYGDADARWDTWRICEFNEILGFYGLAYWYTWQVSILGLGPIWMSKNEALKRKAGL